MALSTITDIELLTERWKAAQPFVVIGSTGIVASGVVATVRGPTDFEPGFWLAAYLVLVGGMAQIPLAAGQARAVIALSRTVIALSWWANRAVS